MAGYWLHEWKYRKIGSPVYINVPGPTAKAPSRAEVFAFLGDREKAAIFYDETIARISDVTSAEQELYAAKAECEKYDDPNFDWRGNNPAKASRMRKNARERVEMAEIRLKKAHAINILLKKECSN